MEVLATVGLRMESRLLVSMVKVRAVPWWLDLLGKSGDCFATLLQQNIAHTCRKCLLVDLILATPQLDRV